MHHVDRNAGILNPEETFSASARRAYQEEFLHEVVSRSYGSGTPLKTSMDALGLTPDSIRTIDDLQKLPVTKKTHLAAAQKANPPFGGYVTVPVADLVRIHQSPGPIYDPVGKVPDYWRWKTALYSVGFRPGDLVVNTFAYHLTPAGHMFEEGISELGATIIPTGVGNTETQVDIMKKLGVTGYIGTPSFLMAILKKAEDMGINPAAELKLEISFLLAEMLPESMRKRFVDEYHIIGRQAYGTADVGCVSYECPKTSGMHVHHDVIVEICNPETGEVLPNGEPGEVVVTCNNKIYPLVRFGTGDLSSIVDETCACGRIGPRLTRILGRADQLTKVKGMFVHPSQVQKVLENHPEILKGRLLVERPKDQDTMTLEVELKSAEGEGLIPAIEQSLKEVIKLKGSVRILEPGTLPPEFKTIEDVRKWD
ncbi:MAG: AMP-binding protein [Desulfomonile tiedjei]|uniref:AMP-binding protein n=1 Tax=Desulfomonile tiedjei TaxID=2358 RepID=A0A9D6Z414_9BACT|nr:AMP-binding protein [Desulfomonile tiedjei]